MNQLLKWILMLLMVKSVQANQVISGYITDAKNGEALIGVSVYTSNKKTGTVSNVYGYYHITISDSDLLVFSYLGYESRILENPKTGDYPIQLNPAGTRMREVEITSRKINPIRLMHHPIDVKQLEKMPALGGEPDLMKMVQLMPGVKKGSDGSSGILVRGGNNDQNIILLDDAPVYNPNHLLGIFSLFNTDIIKEARLQTEGFTANYGGRLSSVLDVRMKDGNNKQMEVSGSIGMIASRLAMHGPLLNGKATYLVAGRISYVQHMYSLAGKELPIYFYDFNGKLKYEWNHNNMFFLSLYNGDDLLKAEKKDNSELVSFNTRMGNSIASLRWNHVFNNKNIYSNFTLFSSRYRYQVLGEVGNNKLAIEANITDYGLRYQVFHQVNQAFSMQYGLEAMEHHISPTSSVLSGNFNDNISSHEKVTYSLPEGAIYYSGTYHVNKKFYTDFGIRYSAANTNGKLYHNPEPRLCISYLPNQSSLFTLSYARMNQYMFQLSGSSANFPTELWYTVTESIKPQQADIYTMGYKLQTRIVTSGIEFYYKPMHNLVEYREGSINLVHNNPDEIIVQGNGKAYGMELSEKLELGKITLSAAYTLSFSNRTFAALNEGKTFYARYDRRHDFNLLAQYAINDRLHLTCIWTYATGSRFTPVISRFMMPNGNFTGIDLLPVYTSRNAVLLSDAHKLDINLVYKNKPGKRFKSEWHVGAYNVYNQTQPYRIKTTRNTDGTYTYKQVGLFGFIPSIAYKFNF